MKIEMPASARPDPDYFDGTAGFLDAQPEKIVEDIIKSFYDPQADKEIITLKFLSLLKSGSAGLSALNYISSDSGALGDIGKKIANINFGSEITARQQIERLMEINRFPNLLSVNAHITEPGLGTIYDYAIKHCYFKGSFEEFMIKISFFDDLNSLIAAQLHDGIMEEMPTAMVNTFGIDSPSYLEMAGPQELLKLKAIEKPNFLLVGSLGKYSAQEFITLSRKINPSSSPQIIDIDPDMIDHFLAAKNNAEGKMIIGDALKMPFKSDCMEIIFTNQLLHNLCTAANKEIYPSQQIIMQFLKEVKRILKPGGSIIMHEQSYRNGKDKKQSAQDIIRNLGSLGANAGLALLDSIPQGIRYAFNQQAGSATIDNAGFAHYGDSLLMTVGSMASLKFTK